MGLEEEEEEGLEEDVDQYMNYDGIVREPPVQQQQQQQQQKDPALVVQGTQDQPLQQDGMEGVVVADAAAPEVESPDPGFQIFQFFSFLKYDIFLGNGEQVQNLDFACNAAKKSYAIKVTNTLTGEVLTIRTITIVDMTLAPVQNSSVNKGKRLTVNKVPHEAFTFQIVRPNHGMPAGTKAQYTLAIECMDSTGNIFTIFTNPVTFRTRARKGKKCNRNNINTNNKNNNNDDNDDNDYQSPPSSPQQQQQQQQTSKKRQRA